MTVPNSGLCSKCNARVPAEFLTRDGQIWIRKTCPDCGLTESLVSSDAEAWYKKRGMFPYVTEDPLACTLHCDTCRFDHKPNIIFLDVTNHCNMNCPICIASVPAMGFDFNPPLAYFEKIFAYVSKFNPPPTIQLFGGEPTVRDDLFEIIALVRKYGMRPNVTTNGLRLADEEYAKKFCDARVGTRFAFDGFNADIYEKLRNNRPAYEKKLAGLANMKKYGRHKQAIISCLAKGINDQHLAEMVQYVHDNRDWISELLLIPLADTWDESFTAAKAATLEDAEKMLMDAIGDGGVEFVPAGLSYAMRLPRSFFRRDPRSETLLLAGVHPNCESSTILVSDGKKYRGINHYLRVPFSKAIVEFAEKCRQIEPRLQRLDPNKPLERLRGQMILISKFLFWGLRTAKILPWMNYNPPKAFVGYIAERLRAKFGKGSDGRKYRRRRGFLRVAMLPFEEQHSVDASRLENCKACFAYEDENGEIQMIPTCMWPPYRNIVLRKVAEKWGSVDSKGNVRHPVVAK